MLIGQVSNNSFLEMYIQIIDTRVAYTVSYKSQQQSESESESECRV